MTSKTSKIMNQMFENQKERLSTPTNWYPFPVFISFGIFVFLFSRILFDVNPRVGNLAEVLSFEAPVSMDGGIWLSLTPINENLMVTTSDGKLFSIPLNISNDDEMKPLVDFLKESVHRITQNAALQNKIIYHHTMIVISADKHLKYFHLKPLLKVMAAAEIRHYAFETKVISKTGDSRSKNDEANH